MYENLIKIYSYIKHSWKAVMTIELLNDIIMHKTL